MILYLVNDQHKKKIGKKWSILDVFRWFFLPLQNWLFLHPDDLKPPYDDVTVVGCFWSFLPLPWRYCCCCCPCFCSDCHYCCCWWPILLLAFCRCWGSLSCSLLLLVSLLLLTKLLLLASLLLLPCCCLEAIAGTCSSNIMKKIFWMNHLKS